MKSVHSLLVSVCFLFLSLATTFAQTTGDYRTATPAAGNWSAASTWQRYNGTAWVAAPSAPTGTGVITIQSADSVFINVAVSISGTLSNQGKLGGTGSLTVANGGTYEHAQNNGSIPVCTWATGSTCLVTGYVTGSKPSNSNQSFYNFRWRCTGQTANVDLAMTGNTIGGDFIVDTSGVSSRVYLTSPASFANPITINGNVIVNGGQCSSNGSGTAATITINSNGNIILNGGIFGVSRGSAPDVTWNLLGNLTVTNATVQNSGGTHVNKLSFAGTGTHNVTLSNVAYGTGTSYFTMEIQSGSTVNLGNSVITSSNSGSFILLGGGTFVTANAGGVGGAVQSTGTSNGGGNSFNTAANYTFNGSVAQVTSALMPTTVNNLIINNAAGVTLSQATTVNGVLRLQAGVFNNTIPFTLGPGATISFEGGSLLVSVKSIGTTIPESFFLDQNYPNPFNPSTNIRFGLPNASYVSIKVFNLLGQEVATLFEGHLNPGIHSTDFDAPHLGAGVYFYRVQTERSADIKRMMLLK